MFERLSAWWVERRQAIETRVLEKLKARYHAFRVFLENNGRALELIGLLDGALTAADDDQVHTLTEELRAVSTELVDGLNMVSGGAHHRFYSMHKSLFAHIDAALEQLNHAPAQVPLVIPLSDVQAGKQHQVGTKAATLTQLRQLGLPVPGGFVVTTQACRRFLEGAGLSDAIGRRLMSLQARPADLAAEADRIGRMIEAAELPTDLAEILDASWHDLKNNHPSAAVSVRSSAVAEDRLEHSFAGQFASFLNITSSQQLVTAYRRVVASNFSAGVIAYRLRADLPPTDFNMAVLVQQMVDARCAGVLLTCDPSSPDQTRMLVSAVPGLGTLAVNGTAPADLYRPSRDEEQLHWSDARIATKATAEVAAEGGGLAQVTVQPDQRDRALLCDAELTELVCLARRIENLQGRPQDIEWAITHGGELRILQARPLRLAAAAPRRERSPLTGRQLASGMCASPGKAVGRVRIVRLAQDLAGDAPAPDHAGPRILLLPQGIVDAARHLCDFEGVIVDMGNPADHLSCIAREYGVPMVTGTLTAGDTLQEGRWVVLDADRGRVFEAPEEVWAALPDHDRRVSTGRNTCTPKVIADPVRQALKQLIVPLNLTDAYGPIFSITECRSLHDLVRLAHESAILSMFSTGDGVMDEAGSLLRRVNLGVPFHFLVIDLGGALAENLRKTTVEMKDIRSKALAALCRGLTAPGLSWHAPPQAGAITGLISRTMLDSGSARPAGEFNYALAAHDYLNLNARVEFHFAMLDTVCSGQLQANYIRFRLKGGGTGAERCARRARFVNEVLQANGFLCSVAGDLVTGTLVGAPQDIIEERLEMIGRLLGYTRLLDAVMHDDETPDRLAKAFLAGRYDRR